MRPHPFSEFVVPTPQLDATTAVRVFTVTRLPSKFPSAVPASSAKKRTADKATAARSPVSKQLSTVWARVAFSFRGQLGRELLKSKVLVPEVWEHNSLEHFGGVLVHAQALPVLENTMAEIVEQLVQAALAPLLRGIQYVQDHAALQQTLVMEKIGCVF